MTPRNRSQPFLRRSLLLLFGVSLVLRMSVAWWMMPRVDGAVSHVQYREYAMAGARLLEHGALLSSLIIDDTAATPSTLMPPLYAGVVACVYRVCGIESPLSSWVLAWINALGGGFAVVGVFLIGHRLGGARAGWIAGALTCVNPMLLGHTHLIWDTSLFTLGVVGTVWWTVRLGDRDGRRSWWQWAAYGVWLGVLAQLNPALTIGYPLLVLWALSRRVGWRLRPMVAGVLVVVGGWLVAITPWTLRNHRVAGEIIYIRGGLGLEFWLGVCPEADTDGARVYAAQFPLLSEQAQSRVATLGERAYVAESRDRAFRVIREDPVRYAKLVAVRAVDYWFGTVYSHVAPGDGGWPGSTPRALGTTFAIFELLLLSGSLLARRRIVAPVRWLLGVVFVFSIVYAATHVQVRFRAPVEPVLALGLALILVSPDSLRRLKTSGGELKAGAGKVDA